MSEAVEHQPAEHEDPVVLNDEFDKKLATSAVHLSLVEAEQRRRWQTRLIVVLVVLNLLLSIAVGVLSFSWFRLSQQANINTAAIKQSCLVDNISRSEDRQLWAYLLSLPPSMPRTPEQQKQVEDLRQYVNKLFAPQKC